MMTTFMVSRNTQGNKSVPDSRGSNSCSQVRGAEKLVLMEGFQHPPWILAEAQEGSVETFHLLGKQTQAFPPRLQKKKIKKRKRHFVSESKKIGDGREEGFLVPYLGKAGFGTCHPLVPDAAGSWGAGREQQDHDSAPT